MNTSINQTQLPTPSVPLKPRGFQERVDYAAKALKRGTWGRRFEACFEEADAAHVAAVLVLRADRNPDLKKAIKKAFQVTRWADVPWAMALPFAASAVLGWRYWATIPALARDRIRAVLGALRARLPGAARAGAGGPE